MNKNRITLASCMIGALFLVGCQKASEPPKPAASTSGTAVSPSQSVAAPANAVPPSDAATKPPAESTSSSGDAQTPTQANPTTLSKTQEQASMPHTGQVNNHSAPDKTPEATTTSQNK
jgi:hypothetical protein